MSWALVIVLSIGLAALATIHFSQHSAESHAVRFQFPLPDKMTMIVADAFDAPVISPDGQRVLLPGIAADGSRHLWLRSLDSLTDQLLPGTEEAWLPFWSPDSRSIAFFTGTKLKRMNAAGGPAQTICAANWPSLGGTWSRNDLILFAGTFAAGIFRVSAAGGEPKPVMQLDKSRQVTNLSFPQFLPDDRHFLYHSQGAKPGLYVGSLDATDSRMLIPEGLAATYVSPGFLVYGSQETLFARRFDAENLQLIGDAVPIAEHVGRVRGVPASLASVSQNGVLVYRGSLSPIQLAWHNREGTRQESVGEPGIYDELDLSPDQRRLALTRHNTANESVEIWILEIPTGILSRLTSHNTCDEPHWSSDSREVVFSSNETGKYDVYRKAVGGSDQTLVFQGDKDAYPTQWLPDGTVLISAPSLYGVPLRGAGKPVALFKFEYYFGSTVSPNGRQIAYYMPEESGQNEVYLAAFPSFNEKRQISNGGGCRPQWRKDGKELFYLSLDGKMMSVAVKDDSGIETSAPKTLFRISIPVDSDSSQYAVSGDGKRFIFGEPADTGNGAITVVLNWQAALKR